METADSPAVIENVSFVIIARNEAFGIEKCLASIRDLKFFNCEVICVDSGSSDETLEIMKQYARVIPSMRILAIRGYSNAAVARNAGIGLATKEYVFFVDGDVEISDGFVRVGLRLLTHGVDCVTGKLREQQYSSDFRTPRRVIEDRFYISSARKIYASGGCFMTLRKIVNDVGLFDERLERSQDYDYTLRLTNYHRMLAIPIDMGTHHTIGYDDRHRLRTHLMRFQAVFFGTALRKNIRNVRGILWLFWRRERGIALGGAMLVLGIILLLAFGFLGLYCLVGIIVLDLLYGLLKKDRIAYRLYLHYVFSLLAVYGFIHTIDRRKRYSVEEVLIEVSSKIRRN